MKVEPSQVRRGHQILPQLSNIYLQRKQRYRRGEFSTSPCLSLFRPAKVPKRCQSMPSAPRPKFALNVPPIPAEPPSALMSRICFVAASVHGEPCSNGRHVMTRSDRNETNPMVTVAVVLLQSSSATGINGIYQGSRRYYSQRTLRLAHHFPSRHPRLLHQ